MSTGYRNRISLLIALGLVGGLFMMDRATARDTLADKIAAFGRTLRGADEEPEMDEGEPLSAHQSEKDQERSSKQKPSRSFLPKVQAGDIVPKNFFGAAEEPLPQSAGRFRQQAGHGAVDRRQLPDARGRRTGAPFPGNARRPKLSGRQSRTSPKTPATSQANSFQPRRCRAELGRRARGLPQHGQASP